MAKQIKTRRATVASKSGIEGRDLLLAGIGAVSLTRKQGIKLYDTLLDEGKQFQGRIEQAITGLQDQAKLGVEIVRERVEAIVTPIRARAEATFGTVKSEVESRLAPVLNKLGVKRNVKTQVRGGAKRAVRKTKAATKRVVRKAKAA
jgi:poly(hydroxyalkanoate) granule-associated protein